MTELKRKRGKPLGSPKSGGRQKGSLNKKSYWLRDQLENIDFSWPQEFKTSMTSADYDRAKILIDLLPYLNPKIEPKKIDDGAQDDDLNINLNLTKMFE